MSKPAADLIQRHRFTVEDFQRLGERSVFRENARVEALQAVPVPRVEGGSLDLSDLFAQWARTSHAVIQHS